MSPAEAEGIPAEPGPVMDETATFSPSPEPAFGECLASSAAISADGGGESAIHVYS